MKVSLLVTILWQGISPLILYAEPTTPQEASASAASINPSAALPPAMKPRTVVSHQLLLLLPSKEEAVFETALKQKLQQHIRFVIPPETLYLEDSAFSLPKKPQRIVAFLPLKGSLRQKTQKKLHEFLEQGGQLVVTAPFTEQLLDVSTLTFLKVCGISLESTTVSQPTLQLNPKKNSEMSNAAPLAATLKETEPVASLASLSVRTVTPVIIPFKGHRFFSRSLSSPHQAFMVPKQAVPEPQAFKLLAQWNDGIPAVLKTPTGGFLNWPWGQGFLPTGVETDALVSLLTEIPLYPQGGGQSVASLHKDPLANPGRKPFVSASQIPEGSEEARVSKQTFLKTDHLKEPPKIPVKSLSQVTQTEPHLEAETTVQPKNASFRLMKPKPRRVPNPLPVEDTALSPEKASISESGVGTNAVKIENVKTDMWLPPAKQALPGVEKPLLPPLQNSPASAASNLPSTAVPGTEEPVSQEIPYQEPPLTLDQYLDAMRELDAYKRKIQVSLSNGRSIGLKIPYAQLEASVRSSDKHKANFETFFFEKNIARAKESLFLARQQLMDAVGQLAPSYLGEGRAVWVDRGSIVASGSEEAFRASIRDLAKAGFNMLYIETLNAGFPIYASKLLPRNPLVQGWDPLAVAVEEGHKHGLEIHAWVWCFAAGNRKHNTIIGKRPSYAGPILEEAGLMPEALKAANGSILPSNQTNYWVSPASPKARKFLLSIYEEIITQYNVDGIQLDYIRYPFQHASTQVGFEPIGKARFEKETGLKLLLPMDDNLRRLWTAWKTEQVSSFVKEVSTTLKTLKPRLKISAAVFPLRRADRILAIQQDWETWVQNGWIDILNPMTYDPSPETLKRKVRYVLNAVQGRIPVYPGVGLYKIRPQSILEQFAALTEAGAQGSTLFAKAHLQSGELALLEKGPFRRKPAIAPHSHPMLALQQVIENLHGVLQEVVAIPVDKGGVALEDLTLIEQDLTPLLATTSSMNQSTFTPSEITLVKTQGQAIQVTTMPNPIQTPFQNACLATAASSTTVSNSTVSTLPFSSKSVLDPGQISFQITAFTDHLQSLIQKNPQLNLYWSVQLSQLTYRLNFLNNYLFQNAQQPCKPVLRSLKHAKTAPF